MKIIVTSVYLGIGFLAAFLCVEAKAEEPSLDPYRACNHQCDAAGTRDSDSRSPHYFKRWPNVLLSQYRCQQKEAKEFA
jgi:hypothetical protein